VAAHALVVVFGDVEDEGATSIVEDVFFGLREYLLPGYSV
jgi:hypothetical protein